MRDKIETLILEALQELSDSYGNTKIESVSPITRLYGGDGVLDSLDVAYMITALEEKIQEEFEKNVLLGDDNAMNPETSPFRDIETLTTYIEQLLKK